MRAGTWSRVYAFQVGGRPCVARFSAHREDFEKDRLGAEYSLQPDARGLPVSLAVIGLGETLGTYYAITERAFGRYLEDLEETETRTRFRRCSRRSMPPAESTSQGRPASACGAPMAMHRTLPGERHSSISPWTGPAPGRMAGGGGLRLRPVGWPGSTKCSSTCWRSWNASPRDATSSIATSTIATFSWAKTASPPSSTGAHRSTATSCTTSPGSISGCHGFPRGPRSTHAKKHGATTRRRGSPCRGFEARLRCYAAHIGIDGMAYSAFLGDWVEFEQKAERALRLVSEG